MIQKEEAIPYYDAQLDPPRTPPPNGNEAAPNTPSSTTPSNKRKRKQEEPQTPCRRGNAGSKWARWEEKVINEAIIEKGEKASNWNDVTQQINTQRATEGDEARTVNSVRLHWKVVMKPKMLE